MPTPIRIPRSSQFTCAVAEHFAARPTLYDVAERILNDQWQARSLAPQPQQGLYLISRKPGSQDTFIRPLHHVLVERYCHERTINLTEHEDHLSSRADADQQYAVSVDLHAVELLLNECGPWLFEAYAGALVAFWGAADAQGQTPWQWYGTYLRTQLDQSIQRLSDDGTLDQKDAEMATRVQAHSQPADVEQWLKPEKIDVHLLRLDLARQWQLEPDLASAVLMEREHGALLYTLSGRLLAFTSRQALLEVLAQNWPEALADARPLLQQSRADMELFSAQALNVLHQQLLLMETACLSYRQRSDSDTLARTLDSIGDLGAQCDFSQQNRQRSVAKRLPGWLRDASVHSLLHYSALLGDIANATYASAGKYWLDGIEDAEAFAYTRLTQRIQQDHPGQLPDLTKIRVVNHQVIAAATANQGTLVQDGVIQVVSFTLAQLAISNLGLLRPGQVTLEHLEKRALPQWLDEAYVRRLISEVDIGTHYPQMLRSQLLDDPQQRMQREGLLTQQLRAQLPAMALELSMLEGQLSASAVDRLGQLFTNEPLPGKPRWEMRRLGLLASPDNSPDHPLNTWLIESPEADVGPCLLYRPLHSKPLLLFADRLALLVAISTPGDLQDDILQRLAPEDRKTYDHGGFVEPHLFHPIDDPFSIPFGTPAPATLAREKAVDNSTAAIYEGCVRETLEQFQSQSSTTAQTRWKRWADLGWMLLDSVLPFTEGAVARVAWLARMEIALTQVVEGSTQDDKTQRNEALVQLLLDLASVILHYAISRQTLEVPAPAASATTAIPAPRPQARLILGKSATTLDFHWSTATLKLTAIQRQTLDELRAGLLAEVLGPPIAQGPLRGMSIHEDAFWVVMEGAVYKVQLDTEQGAPRIVGGQQDERLGPWLQLDEVGRWHPDLRLRLRGGMPLSARLKQMRLANIQALAEMDVQLRQDTEHMRSQVAYLESVAKIAAGDVPPPILYNYLDKAQTFSRFLDEHLARLKARNEKEPLAQYKVLRASALNQRLRCDQSIATNLSRLYRPLRQQIVEMAKRQADGHELSESDESIVGTRIDSLLPLLAQMIDNSTRLSVGLEQLEQLASRSQPQITTMVTKVRENWKPPTDPTVWRLIRLESCTNRLSMLKSLDDESVYWLDHYWSNIELAVAQHLHFKTLDNASEEVRYRLLQSIDQHTGTAQRQLNNFQARLPAAETTGAFTQLQQDLQDFAGQIKSELAEYPDYPARSSVPQLRRGLPGLIETPDEGLLLGKPRPGSDHLVDIPATNDKLTPTRTYRLQDEQWVRVEQPAHREPVVQLRKLKTLLGQGARLLEGARQALTSLQARTASNYLPVEIEEILRNQKLNLDAHRNALEQRLTANNQTDESSSSQDAAITIKALEDLSATLDQQAITLRTRAALAQKPRMGELKFLIDHDQVQIRQEGARKRLAQQKGRPADYLDEYAISHDGQALWYAHFHYRAMDSDKTDFVAGHLKTAAQRFAHGRFSVDDSTGQQTDVYRMPITRVQAQEAFFNL
ncbi:hypothetical protein IAE37_004256 [Pseudomonas sp. S31]|nr:hypothetical protein [Pseudomonas sp. S31]